MSDVTETASEYSSSLDSSKLQEFMADRGIETEKPKKEGSFAKDLTQLPTDIYTGVAKGLNETADILETVGNMAPSLSMTNEEGELSYPRIITSGEAKKRRYKSIGKEVPKTPRLPTAERDDKGALGELVTGVTQFATGLGIAGKALKAFGLARTGASIGQKALKGIETGTLADAIAFDEHENRLSNIVQSYPALQNPITEYLAVDKDDGFVEGKLKQGIESAALGAVGETLFAGIKAYKSLKKTAKAVEESGINNAAKQADDMVGYIKQQLGGDLTDDVAFKLKSAEDEVGKAALLDKEIERQFAYSIKDYAQTAKRYAAIPETQGGKVISTDLGRELSDVYLKDRTKSAVIHEPSSSFVKKLYAEKLKEAPKEGEEALVVFTAGGTGSGKTTAVNATLSGELSKAQIIYDTNLNKLDSSVTKIEQALDAGKDVQIHYVYRDIKEALVNGALSRAERQAKEFGSGRTVPLAEHIKTHEGSYENIKALMKKYKGDERVKFEVIDNSLGKGKQIKSSIDKISFKRYNKEELRSVISEQRKTGKISEATERGFLSGEAESGSKGALGESSGLRASDGGRVASGNGKSSRLEINFSTIDAPEDIKTLMSNMANDKALIDSITATRRGKVKDVNLLQEAQKVDAFDTLMKRRVGAPLGDSEVIAARTLHVSAAEKLREMALKAAGPMASKADIAAFGKMSSVYHAIQKEVLGARAESARGLRAWSLKVAGDNQQAVQQIDDVLTSFNGGETLQELAGRIAKMGDSLTPQQLDVVMEKAASARTVDAVVEAWTLGLLTNPHTHLVNIGSNIMTGLYIGLERGVEALSGNRALSEVGAYFSGYIGSFKEGLLAGARAYKSGEIKVGTKLDLPYESAMSKEVLDPHNKGGMVTGAISFYGNMLEKISGRVLVAGDAFGKTMLYNAELRSIATREALSKGLEGKEMATYVADFLQNPSMRSMSEAIEFSQYATYTNKLGPIGQKWQNIVYQQPMLRLISPFVRTPANIFKFTFSRTPLAYLSSEIRADIAAGGTRAARANSRIGLGSAIMATSLDWAADGSITGAGPTDHNIRNSLRLQGWQPYSFKKGDKYYSYSRFEPLATLIGMSADMAEIMTNYDAYDMDLQNEVEQLWTASAIVMANQLVGKTFLSGVADTAEMLANPEMKMDQYLNRLAGSFVPAGVAGAERSLNPEMEYVKNWTDAIKARVPYLNDSVAKRRDAFGEVVSYHKTGDMKDYDWVDKMVAFVNPVYTSKERNDYVVRNILKDGLYVPDASPNQSFAIGIEDLPEEYQEVARSVRVNLNEYPKAFDDFKRLRGEIELPEYSGLRYKEALRALIDGDLPDSYEFNNPMTPQEDRQKILNRIGSGYTAEAKVRLIGMYPELGGEVIEKLDKTRKSMRDFLPNM